MINDPYQVKTGKYLVGTPEIRLGTILNEGGREGEFFHRLTLSPFLKNSAWKYAASTLLICASDW